MNTKNRTVGLILNYRDAKRTAKCIHTLLAQHVDFILVWDNSDDTGASTRELKDYLADHSKVHIYLSEENLGFAAGVNRSLLWIRSHQPDANVLLINNDAYLLPNATTALNQGLKENPLACIAYPNIDNHGKIVGTRYYNSFSGLLSNRPYPGSFPYASGCCLLISMDRITLPLFDEDFFMYGEDCALGYKLGQKKLAHVRQTLVFHEGSASSGLGSIFYESNIVAAHFLCAHKFAKNNVALFFFLFSRTILLTFRCLLRAFRFNSTVPIRALHHGWRISSTRLKSRAQESGQNNFLDS